MSVKNQLIASLIIGVVVAFVCLGNTLYEICTAYNISL